MKKTRFTEEQMVTILREADRRPVPEVAKRHGVSAQTIYSWRKHFGTLEPADVKRLRQLEQENGRLKKMVADRDRSGPRNLDSGLSEIFIMFQAAVPKLVASKYTTSGVRRPSAL